MVRGAVRQMLAKHEQRKREWREMTHRDHKFNYELWAEFANLGLLGCLVPEEYGGTNSGLLALTLAFEEICALGFSPVADARDVHGHGVHPAQRLATR